MKPSLKESIDHFIVQVGTNDLESERQPDFIAKLIVDVAAALKSEKHGLSISNIIVRNDRFKTKAKEVNEHLQNMCYERDLPLINHSKTLKQQPLNRSRLHLNRRGTQILQNFLIKSLSEIFN